MAPYSLGQTMDRRDFDIGPVLENRRIGPFQAMTLAFGCLILFVDGLDYSAGNGVGYLMAAKSPLKDVLFFIAAPDLVVAAVCVGLDVLKRRPSACADFGASVPVPKANEQLA